MNSNRVAIMQPYFFPYVGYFQLIQSVNKFVFYDDVNFIKRGWINRNNFLVNGQIKKVSIPLQKASQNKLINEILVSDDEKWKDNLLKTFTYSYKQCPYFDDAQNLLKSVLYSEYNNVAELTALSVIAVCRYLNISCIFEFSSKCYGESRGIEKENRLIDIAGKNNAKTYINAMGGVDLYSVENFKKANIQLLFVKPVICEYKQVGTKEFVPNLSILDLIANLGREETLNQLSKGELI